MKKIITAALIASAIIIPDTHYARATENIYLNNEILDSLRTDGGKDKIAVRSFFEAAGYTVLWDGAENRALIFDSDRRITVYADNNVIFIGQTGFFLDENITSVDDTLVMPVDAVRIALDAEIEYRDNDLYITTDETDDSSGWEYEILALTNKKREENGLDKLIWNPDLARAAGLHCEDMIARGYFAHNTPEGIDPFERLRSMDIQFTRAAENLAAGQPDPAAAVEAWMNSEGHMKNILDPALKEMGAAFRRGGKYGIYWAQEFSSIN